MIDNRLKFVNVGFSKIDFTVTTINIKKLKLINT